MKCDYCGSYIMDTDDVCPHCAAPNKGLQRNADDTPRTITELLVYCQSKHMDLVRTGIPIGK